MKAAAALAEILERPDVWRADRLASAEMPAVSSGFLKLDAELPGGGWPRGTLTEILVDHVGLGECSLVLPALGQMREEGRWSLLVAPQHRPHAPAWAAWGVDLARLVVVAPESSRDALWATGQALSSGALGAVLCWAGAIDARQTRRLQVAVAGSNSLAFLFRPVQAAAEASAASLRLVLAAGSRGDLAVNLLKRRGAPCAKTLHLDVPRPLKWRSDHESSDCSAEFSTHSTLARTPPAFIAARSQRPFAVA